MLELAIKTAFTAPEGLSGLLFLKTAPNDLAQIIGVTETAEKAVPSISADTEAFSKMTNGA